MSVIEKAKKTVEQSLDDARDGLLLKVPKDRVGRIATIASEGISQKLKDQGLTSKGRTSGAGSPGTESEGQNGDPTAYSDEELFGKNPGGKTPGTVTTKAGAGNSGTATAGAETPGTGSEATYTASELADIEKKDDAKKTTGIGEPEKSEPKRFIPTDAGVTKDLGRQKITPDAKQEVKLQGAPASLTKYGADWTKGFTRKALRESNLTLGEAMDSYEQYRQEHPEAPAFNPYSYYAQYKDYDLNKSLSENLKDEEKAKNDEKWENIQNALFSFADLYHGVQWQPAPPNAETAEQLTKRQEERRNNVTAMRNKDWQTLMSLWQKQQANDRADRKQQADDAYKRDLLDIKIKDAQAKGDKAALETALLEAKIGYLNAKTEADKQLWAARIKQIEAQTKYTNEKSRGGGSGGRGSKPQYDKQEDSITGYDDKGNKIVEKKITYTPSGGKKKTTKKGNPLKKR